MSATEDYLNSSLELGRARQEMAQEFVRLVAVAGAKANTFLIQKQIEAEYAANYTALEAAVEINKALMKKEIADAD